MSELNQLMVENIAGVIFGMAAMLLLLLVLVIVQGSKLRKLRKNYRAMMDGTGVDNLEALLVELKNQGDALEEGQKEHQSALTGIRSRMASMKSRVAVKRYNAFGERGSDLSFSMVIINDQADGVVVTSLHNRENSYLYAKPLERGESKYPLSPEEKEVIVLAQQQN